MLLSAEGAPGSSLGCSEAEPQADFLLTLRVSIRLIFVESIDVFTRLKTSSDGLSRGVAEARMVEYGPNAFAMEKRRG